MQKNILGPPGTGKTYTLLHILEEKLKGGIRPDEVCYISFTRKAVNEARSRAIDLLKVDENDLPFFRTFHSLAFRQTGTAIEEIITTEHYREIAHLMGVNIATPHYDYDTGVMISGDILCHLENQARIRIIDYRDYYNMSMPDIDWIVFEKYIELYQNYKFKHGLLDFTDILTRFLTHGNDPKIKILIVDEAQDISRVQWCCFDKLNAIAEETYIAGDDDQAIYGWNGADIGRFLEEFKENTVLHQSFRLPTQIQKLSQDIIHRVNGRIEKKFTPVDIGGQLQYIVSLDEIDISSGQWLILCRNNYQIEEISKTIKYMGYYFETKKNFPEDNFVKMAYKWEELRKKPEKYRECFYVDFLPFCSKIDFSLPWFKAMDRVPIEHVAYIKSLRKRRKDLKNPRIKISTIHGSKGGECDNVVVLPDISIETSRGYYTDPDGETRVFYVALTRAKQKLTILSPQTNLYFPI